MRQALRAADDAPAALVEEEEAEAALVDTCVGVVGRCPMATFDAALRSCKLTSAKLISGEACSAASASPAVSPSPNALKSPVVRYSLDAYCG